MALKSAVGMEWIISSSSPRKMVCLSWALAGDLINLISINCSLQPPSWHFPALISLILLNSFADQTTSRNATGAAGVWTWSWHNAANNARALGPKPSNPSERPCDQGMVGPQTFLPKTKGEVLVLALQTGHVKQKHRENHGTFQRMNCTSNSANDSEWSDTVHN